MSTLASSGTTGDNQSISDIATNQKFGQGFVNGFGSNQVLVSFTARLFVAGSPADSINASLYTNSGSLPGSLVETGSNISGSGLTTTPTDVVFNFASTSTIDTSSTYWVVLTRTGSNDGSNFYKWTGNTAGGGKGDRYDTGAWNTGPWTGSAAGNYNYTATGATGTVLPFRALMGVGA